MQILKFFMLLLIFISSTLIGKCISKKYAYRLEELEEIKSILNVFKSKIRFTYEPIQEIFKEISNKAKANIGDIFKKAEENMRYLSAGEAWEKAVKTSETNLTKEDTNVLLMLSKMLGQTDVEGQISQIEITRRIFRKTNKRSTERKKIKMKNYIVGLEQQ